MLYNLKYTNSMPDLTAGYAKAFFIRIRPEYEDDKGLFQHELRHVWQFWRTLGFHSLMYLLIKRYRLASEVEAYKVQLEYIPGEMKEINRKKFSNRISTRYGLKISEDEAYKLLKGEG